MRPDKELLYILSGGDHEEKVKDCKFIHADHCDSIRYICFFNDGRSDIISDLVVPYPESNI